MDLLHEVWEETEQDGSLGVCLAGPMGRGFRDQLAPGARLVHTFWASSHFDAASEFHRFAGYEPYTTEHPQDCEPYSPGWARIQARFLLAKAARDFLAQRFSYEQFLSSTRYKPDDDDVAELLDLLEHEPAMGGLFGASEDDHDLYVLDIRAVIDKLEKE